jgi:hypothetical protein
VILLLIGAGAAAYYRFVYSPRPQVQLEAAWVLPATTEVVDTPAAVHVTMGSLKSGERVEILLRTRNWAKVRFGRGQVGWVVSKDLVDAITFGVGQKLLKDLERLPTQAAGHTSAVVNLRVEPSRDAPQLGQLNEKQRVEIFGRRLVNRDATSASPAPPLPSRARDAWYLVRAEGRAGWVLGRLVSLDIPPALSDYAQGVNLVAWVILNTVQDGPEQVPQYLAADRMGTPDCDFNHFRIFTWWVKHHKYVTAYVESNLNGYFPILVARVGGVPHFRLRLMDDEGHKFQRVYGLFDTITHPVGDVEGWESEAMPVKQPEHGRKRARRR